MRKHDEAWALSVATGALGVIAALTLAAPPAQADPEVPIPPPPPPPLLLPAEESISTQAAADNPAAGDPAAGHLAVGDPAASDLAAGHLAVGDPAAGDPAAGHLAVGDPAVGDPAAGEVAVGDLAPPAPPAEVPHLMSPENLPPGTTITPLDPEQGRTTSYLRDLWHAVQTQEISGRDAILLLTQRPLDPTARPTNGLPAGPQAPLPAEPAPAPELAPPLPAPELAPRHPNRRCHPNRRHPFWHHRFPRRQTWRPR